MRTSIQRSVKWHLPFMLATVALAMSGCEEAKESSGCYVCVAASGTFLDGVGRTDCLSADASLSYLAAGYLCQDPLSGAFPPIPDGGLVLRPDTKRLLGFHFTTVPAMPVTDEEHLTITTAVPHGMAVSGLVASFVLAGKSVTVNGVAQVSEVTVNDFSRPVSYVVTAMDGSTATYVVTVTPSSVTPAAPTGVQAVAGYARAQVSWTASDGAWSYSIYSSTTPDVSPTKNDGAIHTPPGSGVTSVPVGPLTIGTTHYFVVTAENGTLVSPPSSPPVSAIPTVSESMKQLLGFHFTTIPALPVTDDSALTIKAEAPHGTDLTSLVASFVLGGKSVTVNGVAQVSEVTVNDFSRPVSYVVTAMDGSTATYVVTVTASGVTPAKPTGVTAVAGVARAQVSWTASDGAWSYSVHYSTSAEVSPTKHDGVLQTPPGSGVTSVPLGPLTIGTRYYFVVTAENGTLVSPPSSPPVSAVPTMPESTKQLLGFHFTTVPAMPVTDEASLTITAKAPYGMEVTALVASFVLAGQSVTVNGVPQVSEKTTNDFTHPVSYVVTAVDGSTATYVVSVVESPVAPAKPAAVQAVGGFAQAQVSWAATNGAWSYSVYASSSPTVSPTSYTTVFRTPAGSGVTSIPFGPLTIGTTYYFVVTADNGTLSSPPSSPPASATPTASNTWTWVTGYDPSSPGTGTYGIKGTADAKNIPPPRERAMSWLGADQGLYVFGGAVKGNTSTHQLSDLWRFDQNGNWTWMAGVNTQDNASTLGDGPGAREGAATWTDASGNLYLFGGYGRDSQGTLGELNDLWRFNLSAKIWSVLSGGATATIGGKGVYGTRAAIGPGNWPGARDGAVVWVTTAGNGTLWLFGGTGVDSIGAVGRLNDLWKFDGTNWIWVAGSNGVGQQASYGTLGQPSATNVPGARGDGAAWVDASGKLWLFGGQGKDPGGHDALFSDLWRFDPGPSTWAWMGGSNAANELGSYGVKATPGSGARPGARQGAVSWSDGGGGVWLFGGLGYASGSSSGQLNDLWRFDGTSWTWMSGDAAISRPGHYGTKGQPNPDNAPSARRCAVSWLKPDGTLLMFGGGQPDLSEIWAYIP